MAEFQSIQVSSAAGQFYLKNAVKETENDAPETFVPECNSFPNQLTKLTLLIIVHQICYLVIYLFSNNSYDNNVIT